MNTLYADNWFSRLNMIITITLTRKKPAAYNVHFAREMFRIVQFRPISYPDVWHNIRYDFYGYILYPLKYTLVNSVCFLYVLWEVPARDPLHILISNLDIDGSAPGVLYIFTEYLRIEYIFKSRVFSILDWRYKELLRLFYLLFTEYKSTVITNIKSNFCFRYPLW